MTVISTVAVCIAAAVVLTISAARPVLPDVPQTPERVAAPAFHCEHFAQWARQAPLSPDQAAEMLGRCQASLRPMAISLRWDLLARGASR